MYKNPVIKKIIASAMLIVFAFSITPTIVLHNWLADHSDTVKKITDTKGEQIGKKTFNCHCDNIVAESPFTEPAKTIFAAAEKIFSCPVAKRHIQFTPSQNIIHSLRGPPAV